MYLDYQEHNAGVYVVDIETDSLTPKVIWVMCWKNVKTGETGECRDYESIKKWFESHELGSIYVGHNLLKFDGPVLSRLLGIQLSPKNCIDTLVLSTLYNPSLEGGHSLGAWGEKLGREKIEFSDWSGLSEEMVEYCHRDVEITCELFRRLIKTMARIGFSERSIGIQHYITEILYRQQQNGFYFNGPEAVNLYRKLRSREEELQDEIRKVFPPERVLVAVRRMFTKTGEPTAIFERDKQRYVLEVDDGDGSYRAFEDVEFNIGSPNQRVGKLLALGWEPEEFTPKTSKGGGGNPKPFDKGELSPSLERFLEGNDIPEVHLIAKWMSINGRANMINTWLENWNEEDSCIHGNIFVADTLRFRHQAPNTANIPAVRTRRVTNPGQDMGGGQVLYGEEGYYTYEARNLWCARPGRVLIGTDAAGLELRMLAHYLNRPEFTAQVVDGDPHQYNADLVGITRPQAKTLIYAVLYGAAAPKVAKTLGVSVKEGANIRTMFLEKLGLKDLINECQREQREGRIILCDGSLVVCRSPHASLNYKLQGGGARVMAMGAIILENYVRRLGLDSLKVGDIHDEWVYDVDPSDADSHAEASVRAIQKAGEVLNLNVPLDGKALIGSSWAHVH